LRFGDRRRFIGGSDARIIMGQDEKALIRLWQEKRGGQNLIVQLGVVTEDLNRVWYKRNAVQSGLTCRFFEETWRGSRSFGDAPPASHR
jgi:hypothetical protein